MGFRGADVEDRLRDAVGDTFGGEGATNSGFRAAAERPNVRKPCRRVLQDVPNPLVEFWRLLPESFREKCTRIEVAVHRPEAD